MPEPPEVIVGKRNVVAFAIMLVICLLPVLDVITGWSGPGETKNWVLWIATLFAWIIAATAFLTRVRADGEGVEMRRPLLGTRRIVWADVVAVYEHDLAVGTGTTIRSRDGQSIWLSDVLANRAEIEDIVVERSGIRKS